MLRQWFTSVLVLLASATLSGQVLHGAGSTFVYPIMTKWASEYHKSHPQFQIDYLAIGSGAGIAQATQGLLDFGATDAPISDSQLSGAVVKVIHIPVILGADVPAYNLPEVQTQLRFTGPLLADIFLGKIQKWNDPAIASVNPGVHLPNRPITTVHRRDGSGTTYIWTDYLSRISPEWKSKVGKGTSVKWPMGIDANGNEGVSEAVRNTAGGLGYLELSYAEKKRIAFGSVQNADGAFISANVSAIEEAASSIKEMPNDFRVSISNAPGKNAYPISSFSWVLVPERPRNPSSKQLMVDFLKWALSDGQSYAEDLYYSPLPTNVTARVMSAIQQY